MMETSTARRYFFKGFSRSQKRFLTPEELALSGVFLGPRGHLEHSADIILCEFSGKQDIKGRPIFEHDVVDFDQLTYLDDSLPPMARRARGVLNFNHGLGQFVLAIKGAKENMGQQFDVANPVLIGSLLDKPELLDQEPTYAEIPPQS